MQEYQSLHTQSVVKAFQWDGSDESLEGLDLPVMISEPDSGIVQLKTDDGLVEMHMGYYFMLTEKGWTGLGSDAFQAEYLPLT